MEVVVKHHGTKLLLLFSEAIFTSERGEKACEPSETWTSRCFWKEQKGC